MTAFGTTSREFFDSKYAADPDPWNFTASPYERDRYATTLRALGGHRYRRAFEPGCSIGILTEQLATLCDYVEALEISPIAAARARERCAHLSNVSIHAGALPEAIPSGAFDLIVLSEIGYYFQAPDLARLGETLLRQLTPGSTLLAVHWLGHSLDHILSGDEVHQTLATLNGITIEHTERHESFRLDRWRSTK